MPCVLDAEWSCRTEMNRYVRNTHSRKARMPVRVLSMMMRLCVGLHEARTTMKWSFVSVREG